MTASFRERAFGHFKTITKHKWLVCKGCFSVGLYRQGLLHDLSKYSPSEFCRGVHYYQGTRSPNNAERDETGASLAWLHHKGRNKHHYEYWLDYNPRVNADVKDVLIPVKMPGRYVIEMVIDRIAASKVYRGSLYTDKDPLEYFLKGTKSISLMHPETRALTEKLLRMLAAEGEEKTFAYIRAHLRRRR